MQTHISDVPGRCNEMTDGFLENWRMF